MCRRAILPHAHPALTFRRQVAVQRQAHMLLTAGPASLHEHEVPLADRASADLGVYPCECAALLCKEQHARGVAIQAMDELQESRVRALCPHSLDHTHADAAATM